MSGGSTFLNALRGSAAASASSSPYSSSAERSGNRSAVIRTSGAPLFALLDDELAASQRGRAGQAEVGEDHVALLLGEALVLGAPHRQDDAAERQPLQPAIADERLGRRQRHLGRIQLRHRMASGLRPRVGVSGRAGVGHRLAAGRHDDRRGAQLLSVAQPDAADASARDEQSGGLFVQSRLDAARSHGGDERVDDGLGLVRHGKHAPAVLFLEPDAERLEKADDLAAAELRQRAVQELAVARDVPDQLLRLLVVGDVAASAAGYGQLASELAALVEQQHARSLAACGRGGHQAGRPSSDDDDVESILACHS